MKVFKAVRNLLLLIILILIFYLITYSISKYTGFIILDNDSFVDCLNEKDISLYVYKEISELKTIELDKFNFKVYKCKFEELKCLENNISLYPSWKIDEKIIEKDVNIFELSDISGCEIN